MVARNGRYVHEALDRFQEAREGARRFHADAIGKDVDAAHCFADFLCLVRMGDAENIEKRYWANVTKSAMNEVSGVAGGYLVPPDLATGMLRDISTGSLWRKYGAYVQPMKTQSVTLPVPDVSTAQSAGVDPYLGGFLMQWTAEQSTTVTPANSNIQQTGMAFRDVTLTAWELAGWVYASNPFLQDSVGVEEWLTRLFANGAAWYQDLAFFQGNGVGKPMGVINSPGVVQVSRGSGFDVTAATSMIEALLPSAWESGAVWFCHPSALSSFTALTGWFPNGPLMAYGLPIVVTGKCATSGSQGDIILAAPQLYIIGDRLTVEVALAPEEPGSFYNNQSAFRIMSRVDGQPAVAAPITLSDASSKVSPFVVLA